MLRTDRAAWLALIDSRETRTLLRQLAAYNTPFDASKIYAWALKDQALLDATRFLWTERKRKAAHPQMTENTIKRIRRWLDQIEGKEIAGLILSRNQYGWCS